jgi:lysosomal alpha-mannosidase
MYEAPPNFCFDINCKDEPIMDNPKLKGYNIDRRAWEFADYFRDMCLHYKSNTLMHTMGSDF